MKQTKQQINKTEESGDNPTYFKMSGIRTPDKMSIICKGIKQYKRFLKISK